jgi:hypothetical protein
MFQQVSKDSTATNQKVASSTLAGRTILFSGYIEAADAEGMGAFNLPADLYNALQSQGVAWTANQAYITTQVLLGRAVFLAGPAVTNSTTTLSLELDHLIQIGSGPSSWTLLHTPFL